LRFASGSAKGQAGRLLVPRVPGEHRLAGGLSRLCRKPDKTEIPSRIFKSLKRRDLF
jgi:hypothetical protein